MENPYQAPEANLTNKNSDAKIIDSLPRFSAWGVFFLSLFTLGIYGVYWLYKRTELLNELSKTQPISRNFITTAVSCYAVLTVLNYGGSFLFGPELPMALSLTTSVLSLVNIVLLIMWYFGVKRLVENLPILIFGEKIRLSGVMTFFFNVIYLQYKINQIIDLTKNKNA